MTWPRPNTRFWIGDTIWWTQLDKDDWVVEHAVIAAVEFQGDMASLDTKVRYAFQKWGGASSIAADAACGTREDAVRAAAVRNGAEAETEEGDV
jgi:hypothetical protein